MKKLSLLALLVIGCATTSLQQQFWASRAAYNGAKSGFDQFLVADNEQVWACIQAHPHIEPEKAKTTCPAILNEERRAKAFSIVQQADAQMSAIDALVSSGQPPDQVLSEAVGQLETFTLRLIISYQGVK